MRGCQVGSGSAPGPAGTSPPNPPSCGPLAGLGCGAVLDGDDGGASFVTGEASERVRRIRLDLSRDDHRALLLASVEDETPMTEVLRASVAL